MSWYELWPRISDTTRKGTPLAASKLAPLRHTWYVLESELPEVFAKLQECNVRLDALLEADQQWWEA